MGDAGRRRHIEGKGKEEKEIERTRITKNEKERVEELLPGMKMVSPLRKI